MEIHTFHLKPKKPKQTKTCLNLPFLCLWPLLYFYILGGGDRDSPPQGEMDISKLGSDISKGIY